jgi:ubiquinone/menaquinone biosynthesis C-methylase UbiE
LAFEVPVFCNYTAEDYFSLSEVLQGTDRVRKDNYDEFDISQFLSELHNLPANCTRQEAVSRLGYTEEPYWFPNRFQEHEEFQDLTDRLDFTDKLLLDVGAGYGSDSLRYSLKGAKITALEYSPSMFAIGRSLRPEFNWVGGSADQLPFTDNSFDFVVAHNSLHHHLNPLKSLIEMLRVLKVGGMLITSGDPFVSHDIDEIGQCEIFNDHPGVLAGINEQVLPFSVIKDLINFYGADIEGSILSRESGDSTSKDSFLETFCEKVPPSFSAALKIKKLNQTEVVLAVEGIEHFNIEVGEVVTAIKESLELDLILKYLPGRFFDIPILSSLNPKFFLLNGWKQFNPLEMYRVVSGKLKYFTILDQDAFCTIIFKIENKYQIADFVLTINGHPIKHNIQEFEDYFICTSREALSQIEYGHRICIEFSLDEEREISSHSDAASIKMEIFDLKLHALPQQAIKDYFENQPSAHLQLFRTLKIDKSKIKQSILRRFHKS